LHLTGAQLRSLQFSGDAQTMPATAAGADSPVTLGGNDSGGPVAVEGWYISLVGIDAKNHRAVVLSHPGSAWKPSAKQLRRFAGYPEVIAVVAHDDTADATDDSSGGEQSAHYQLTVDGSTQPGG
jgi:hypothetical protein